MKTIINNQQENYVSYEFATYLKGKGYLNRVHSYWIENRIGVKNSNNYGLCFSTLRQNNIPHGFDSKEINRIYRPTHSIAQQWMWDNFRIWISVDIVGEGLFFSTIVGKDICAIIDTQYKTSQQATNTAFEYIMTNDLLK